MRVTEKGHRSFVLVGRFPNNPYPTRRLIGEYGKITLDDAREEARAWYALLRKGIDPMAEVQRRKVEAQRSQVNTFEYVAEQFLERYGQKELKRYDQVCQTIRDNFIARWKLRPITEITDDDVAVAIRVIVARGTPATAHNAFAYIRRLFSWAIGTKEFGIKQSPCTGFRPTDLIGQRVMRNRILTDEELRKVWVATDQLGFPSGGIVQMLILTGQRLREIGSMSWSELNLDQGLLTIGADRMKSGNAHEVPLAPMALELMKPLPRFKGDFVFTTNSGRTPFAGYVKCKQRLDRLSGVSEWTFHDLRRTARTHFGALPVQDNVRELVIAHAQSGLHKTYDLHTYQSEKRECLRLWELRLQGIINPKPIATVTDLGVARSKRQPAA